MRPIEPTDAILTDAQRRAFDARYPTDDRRCVGCGAKLSRYNRATLCVPCAQRPLFRRRDTTDA